MIRHPLCNLSKRWILSKRSFVTDLSPVVGLEIHMQILSASKLFSPAPTSSGDATNQNVSLFDAAIPGTLPTLNKRCLEAAVAAAVAFNCNQINNITRFDRKHYFYADMPSGYQITQQFKPIARDGLLEYFVMTENKEARKKQCRLHQIQIEQDSGRSIHDGKHMCSYIDLNRAGVGLLEFVFEPDLSSGLEAACLVQEFLGIVKALDVSNGLMNEGAVRVDANVSVHEPGTPFGVRTEIKNLNSISSVRKAIDYEIQRQQGLRSAGKIIHNVTMTFDVDTDSTVMLRDKEVLQDYRFFPEPNIPMVDLKRNNIDADEMRKALPPLPPELRENLMENHGVPYWKTVILLQEPLLCEYFCETVEGLELSAKQKACDTLITTILGYIVKHSVGVYDMNVKPHQLRDLIECRQRGEITRYSYNVVLEEMLRSGGSPRDIIARRGCIRIHDEDYLTEVCKEAIRLNARKAEKYALTGKTRALGPMYQHITKKSKNRLETNDISRKLNELLKTPGFLESLSEQGS